MSRGGAQNLFTRFYRAKNDTTTQITGTGLGLYLTKYFIEAHQGRVEVESELGPGQHVQDLPAARRTLRCWPSARAARDKS